MKIEKMACQYLRRINGKTYEGVCEFRARYDEAIKASSILQSKGIRSRRIVANYERYIILVDNTQLYAAEKTLEEIAEYRNGDYVLKDQFR